MLVMKENRQVEEAADVLSQGSGMPAEEFLVNLVGKRKPCGF